MIKTTKKTVLVLGANGMIGRAVFTYLQTIQSLTVWGTIKDINKSSNKKISFVFDNNIKKLVKIISTKKIDYVINCIGIISESESLEKMILVNSLLPHQLERLAEEYNFKLIHISTDSVFGDLSGKIDEFSKTSPENNYSASKLLGETTSKNALTIRTSFIGFDKEKHKGILEKALKNRNTFVGYSNHIWTGCTTLQFASFCADIITQERFSALRKQSPLFHFAPLGPISKYDLIKIFMKLIMPDCTIMKSSKEKRERILQTKFSKALQLQKYILRPDEELRQLIDFEKR